MTANPEVSTGLADVVAQIAHERQCKADARAEYEAEVAARDRRIVVLEHRRDLLAASSLTARQLDLAKGCVVIGGSVGDSAEGAFDAAIAAIAEGGVALKDVYIGAKRYDGFHQRCDCRYGYGPKHGSIVFSVGLTQGVRDLMPETVLSHEQRDAAVGWLLAERRLAESQGRTVR